MVSTETSVKELLGRLFLKIELGTINSPKSFVRIERGLNPKERQAIFSLGLPGVTFREELKSNCLLDEKERFLKLAADKNYFLFLEHDAHNELITVKHTEKGVRLGDIHDFNNLF